MPTTIIIIIDKLRKTLRDLELGPTWPPRITGAGGPGSRLPSFNRRLWMPMVFFVISKFKANLTSYAGHL